LDDEALLNAMCQWLQGRSDIFYQTCVQGWIKLVKKMETILKENYAFSNALVKCLILLGAESFVFQVAIQKLKD
jgi:hypothetical protein